jgi:flavodoxin
MRLLILYYTRTGHNEKLCQELQQALGCPMEKIIEPVDRSGLWKFILSGWEAVRKKTTAIAPIENDLAFYDVVILGTPFWAGNLPPATRTFLRQYKDKIKRMSAISVSGMGDKNKNALASLEAELGKNVDPYLFLSEKEFIQGTYKKDLDTLIKGIQTLRNVKGDLQQR